MDYLGDYRGDGISKSQEERILGGGPSSMLGLNKNDRGPISEVGLSHRDEVFVFKSNKEFPSLTDSFNQAQGEGKRKMNKLV